MESVHVLHPFEPIFDEKSRILILGSFPSVKSREDQFYYGHKRNRFWAILSEICGCRLPVTVPEKTEMLLKHHIALWDVIESCDIAGSSDSSIKNVKENDMNVILKRAPIRKIFANGGKAYQLFVRYCQKEGQPEVRKLPSSSPANAAWSLERLVKAWEQEIAGEL